MIGVYNFNLFKTLIKQNDETIGYEVICPVISTYIEKPVFSVSLNDMLQFKITDEYHILRASFPLPKKFTKEKRNHIIKELYEIYCNSVKTLLVNNQDIRKTNGRF